MATVLGQAKRAAIFVAVLGACTASASTTTPFISGAHAQIGPPIPADQVIRQQNQPIPPIPSPPVPASPRPGPPMPAQVPAGRGNVGDDRAARCQHQAAVERVPRSRRGAYVRSCINE